MVIFDGRVLQFLLVAGLTTLSCAIFCALLHTVRIAIRACNADAESSHESRDHELDDDDEDPGLNHPRVRPEIYATQPPPYSAWNTAQSGSPYTKDLPPTYDEAIKYQWNY
ncbi:uncharacterized protein LOC141900698 [Tubulanus polymorphus]|uniref:uncharacterized protein LOC141900698 n=1 Tax=Tubulanus polymorphus TaxID=672921 RepID=UPI003DA58919